ncbi:MAG: ornithine aminomutase subunit alpha [Spirochaetota bacterium]|nr:ornithine aminomutase subunit alpha [Spirochaetota bacterium]
MERAMERPDDYLERREHLKHLTEEQLESKFWELTEKLMNPVIEIAETHTSPSIERSVLLRMGFSSLESTAIVKQVMDHGLMGKGAGHIVYKTAKAKGLDIREAGLQLAEGQLWDKVGTLFGKETDISRSKDAIYRVSDVRANGLVVRKLTARQCNLSRSPQLGDNQKD